MPWYRINFIWILGFLLLAQGGWAQSYNVRTQKFSTKADTIQLDSLSIIEATFHIQGIDTSNYELDPLKSQLIWKQKPQVDSITATYQVFPINFSKTYANKPISAIGKDQTAQQNPFRYSTGNIQNKTAGFSELEKRGSISRGINFGNNQNLGVNSNMNLQLSGKLTDKVNILATISDENIPIEPEGNTQQIQDFDQVFIRLYDNRSQLTAGDYQIQSGESFFMKYNKRLRGGSFETQFPVADKKGMNLVGAGAAISRGKFSRNIIQGNEGNQGPYRLTGAENETYIIILSGTERVFIDGKELTRGQENDYVIDYNQAEITFTAKQPITKDKRIIVEFQYSSQAYSRSLIEVHDQFQTKKLKLNFNLYAEQDARNQPLQQDLSDADRNLLINVGDNIDQAVISGVEQVEFADDQVLYKLEQDTNTDGTIDSIYVYSTSADSAIYQVSFSDMGFGNGNYVRVNSTANGQVYEYIAPINGEPQGRYDPIVVLITPKLRQMVSLGGSYQVSKNSTINFEGALSRRDINTFSSSGDEDNFGTALFVEYDTRKYFQNDTSKWALTATARHEQVAANFEQIEYFRSAEFDRDWNIRDIELTQDQYLPSASVGLMKNTVGKAEYQLKTYLAGGQYSAIKHGAVADLNWNGFSLDYNGSLMNTEGDFYNSEYNRQQTLLTKSFKKFKVGYRDDVELNRRTDPNADTLLSSSYQFYEWEAFISSPDSAVNTYKISYTQRRDKAALENQIQDATFGQSYGFEFGLLKNPNNQLKGKTTYRILDVNNNELYQDDPEENLISRLEYTLRLLKGGLTSNSFYEIGSGLEERIEYVYIEVSAGQGTYTWIDYNDNGIKEQNEFQVAIYSDQANYERVTLTTNDFIQVYNNQFNQVFFIQPEKFLNSDKGLGKIVSKFSDQLAYRIERNTQREEDLNRFNPFYTSIADSNLVSITSSFRNTVYFNQNHPKFGVEFTVQENASKQLQTTGFDGNQQRYQTSDVRYNINREFQLNLGGTTGTRKSQSELYNSQNYTIDYFEINPRLTYQPKPSFNLTAGYEYDEMQNIEIESDNEFSSQHTMSLELKWNQVGKGSLNLTGRFLIIEFTGNATDPIAYDMLQGLLPGNNGTWEVYYQRNLGNNLQMTLTYAGRKSENTDFIHTGGVQVRAYF